MKSTLLPRLPRTRRSRRRACAVCCRVVPRRLAFEQLEDRHMLSLPVGAVPNDTAEYMLGDVSVTLVLMESDGSIDPSTEDWTPEAIEAIKDTVAEGLQWWEDVLALEDSVHLLDFFLDTTYADSPVPTGYEPISRPWDGYQYWVEDFLDHVGFSTSAGMDEDIRSFNDAQRTAHDTDWSFTIFIANSANDLDDRFELGHEFSGAFAFAGGLFFVSPSGRPASTMAHETGHIFYAKDEYPGGASYYDCRGYYNTQNTNAWDDNPDPDSRVDSIMSSGVELQSAYAQHLVSVSAREMIGWKDSDGDGVFDVLDVPLALSGSGALDPDTQTYRFLGESSVQALPNRNPSGRGNDITINEISRAQFRFDGGDWQTAEVYHTAAAELDLTIAVPAGVAGIEIRTIDDDSGVTSEVFSAAIGRAESVQSPGINGFVWIDVDGDGLREAGEPGLEGWTVTLGQAAGIPLASPRIIEPDDFSAGGILDTAYAGATLSVETVGGFSSGVGVAVDTPTSTGQKVFAYEVGSSWSTLWASENRRLRIDFASPVSRLRIDVVADTYGDFGRLEVFDAGGQLLARSTSGRLGAGGFETLEITRPTPDIAYAIVGGHMGSEVHLDNLQIGIETTVETGELGAFTFAGLDPDAYLVAVSLPTGWTNVSPQSGEIALAVGAGEVIGGVDFGVYPVVTGPAWQNPANPLDVNDDGVIAAQDALWVANDLYFHGPRLLPVFRVPPDTGAPYLDVNGDGYVTVADALLVARHLQSSSGGGASGESPCAPAVGGVAGDGSAERGAWEGGDETPSTGSPDPQGPAVRAEALAQWAAKSDHRGASATKSLLEPEPTSACCTRLRAFERLAGDQDEPSTGDDALTLLLAEQAASVRREAEGDRPTVSPASGRMKDADAARDSLFCCVSWLEGLLATCPSETSPAAGFEPPSVVAAFMRSGCRS